MAAGYRVLVTTLTKKMAESLTEYFTELDVRVRYLHSDIDTLERQETIQALCARPDMAHAIRTLSPAGMSRNKQLAAKLVRGGRFWLLSQLYRIKNRI